MKKYIVTLKKDERKSLTSIISKGKHRSQKVINSLILLGCDEGDFQRKRSPNKEIARVLKISMNDKNLDSKIYWSSKISLFIELKN